MFANNPGRSLRFVLLRCPFPSFRLVQGLNKSLSPTKTLVYAKGCQISGNDTSHFPQAKNASQSADVTIIVVGMDQTQENGTHDRTDIALPGVQDQLVASVRTCTPATTCFVGSTVVRWCVLSSSVRVRSLMLS